MLLLACLLAYQAQVAARSHREAAERTLRDYSGFAMAQLSREVTQELLAASVSTFLLAQRWVDPARPAAWPTAYGLMRALDARHTRVPYLDGVRFYFRLDLRDGTLTTAGGTPDPAVARWIRDTVGAFPGVFPQSSEFQPLVYGGPASPRATQLLRVVLSNDQYGAVVARVAGEVRVITFGVSRGWEGEPLVVYGFEAPAASFVGPVLRRVMESTPLLPASLVRGIAADSIAAVRVAAADGTPLFVTRSAFPAHYDGALARTERLDPRMGGLALTVTLNPALAPRLVVGGLPRSRLPAILGLLGLTAALLVVALVQLRRHEELARLRTEFVAGVSHELRTPLAQIRLFGELIRDGQLRAPGEQARAGAIIDEEAQRLTTLIDGVLAFSRVGAPPAALAPAPVELEAELRAAVEAFAPLVRARRLRFEWAVWPPDAPVPQALADRAALRQIAVNLLDNAAKYSPPGSAITLGVRAAGAFTRFWVDDAGPGIPVAERRRVWEPYVRLRRPADAAAGGSGIGLAVVGDLVARQGGRAWLESAPTGGARAVVELPAAPPVEAREDARAEARAALPHEMAAAGRAAGGNR